MLKNKIKNPCLSLPRKQAGNGFLLGLPVCVLISFAALLGASANLCGAKFLTPAFAKEQFVYDAKGKRDPFIPLVTPDGRLLQLDKEETRKDLSVEGIMYDKHGGSFAIVNGSVVGIGDSVGDYQVLKIEQEKVILIKEGQIREVEIDKEEK